MVRSDSANTPLVSEKLRTLSRHFTRKPKLLSILATTMGTRFSNVNTALDKLEVLKSKTQDFTTFSDPDQARLHSLIARLKLLDHLDAEIPGIMMAHVSELQSVRDVLLQLEATHPTHETFRDKLQVLMSASLQLLTQTNAVASVLHDDYLAELKSANLIRPSDLTHIKFLHDRSAVDAFKYYTKILPYMQGVEDLNGDEVATSQFLLLRADLTHLTPHVTEHSTINRAAGDTLALLEETASCLIREDLPNLSERLSSIAAATPLLNRLSLFRDCIIRAYAEGTAQQLLGQMNTLAALKAIQADVVHKVEESNTTFEASRALNDRIRASIQAREYGQLAATGNGLATLFGLLSGACFYYAFYVARPQQDSITHSFTYNGSMLWFASFLLLTAGMFLKASLMERHNALVNRHKERTLNSYTIFSKENPEAAAVLLPLAAAAIFSHQPTGYSKSAEGDPTLDTLVSIMQKKQS